MFTVSRIAVFFALLIYATPLMAQMQIVPVEYGVNSIDLDGDGKAEKVIKSWHENFNAHGYISYLFLEDKKTNQGQISAIITTQVGRDGAHLDMVRSTEGADCKIEDFWLVHVESGQSLELLRASRSLENGYSAKEEVMFEFYKLTSNQNDLPGTPYKYWRKHKFITSKQKYCDVYDAMNKELSY